MKKTRSKKSRDTVPLKTPTNFFFFKVFFFLLLMVHFHRFSKIKCHGEVTNNRNLSFSYCFCLLIEGSGSVPLTYGSGSGSRRPKNMQIRICNTAGMPTFITSLLVFLLSVWQVELAYIHVPIPGHYVL